jgi:hypothetical protein
MMRGSPFPAGLLYALDEQGSLVERQHPFPSWLIAMSSSLALARRE